MTTELAADPVWTTRRLLRVAGAPTSALPWVEEATLALAALVWLAVVVPDGYIPGGSAVPVACLALIPALLATRPAERLPLTAWTAPVALGGAALVVIGVTPTHWASARLAGYFLYTALAFVTVAAYASTAVRRRAVALTLCAVGGVVAVEAFPAWWSSGRPDALMTAPIGWHNQLAAFLLPAAVVGGGLFVGACGATRLVGSIAAVVPSVAIVLTTSRAGMVLLAVGWLSTGGFAVGRKDRWAAVGRWLSIPLLVTALMLFVTSHLFFPHATYHFPLLGGGRDSSRGPATMAGDATARLQYARAALAAWAHAPLAGNGFGSFFATSARYLPHGAARYAVPYDMWVDALTSGGLLFAAPLLLGTGALVVVSGRGLRARAGRGSGDAAVAVGAALSALLLLGHFAFDVDIDYPACAGMLGVVAGLSFSCGRRNEAAGGADRSTARVAPAALSALALVATACGLFG